MEIKEEKKEKNMEPQMAENYWEYGACFAANISLVSQQSQDFLLSHNMSINTQIVLKWAPCGLS